MSLDISGALLAPGLPEADAETLEALIDVIEGHAARNRRLVAYYEGDVAPAPIGIDTLPESVEVPEHCDWPRKAVTSVSERSRLSGFVFDGEDDPTLAAVVRDNDLVGAYSRHVHSELVHGCMFATVGMQGGRCAVRFHTAETAGAIWDDAAGRVGCGLVVAETSRTKWSPKVPVPTRLNMHLPGRVVTLVRTGVSDWAWKEYATPLDRPAMEAFAYRPTGLRPFGESRISKTVMSLTGDVLRTLQNMAVSSAIYSSPQKYLLGLSAEAFDRLTGADADDADGCDPEAQAAKARMSAWSLYITRTLVMEQDEDGNSPTFGQLTAASPEPYIAVLRTYATLFSGATGVPLNSLGIVQDNPSSAEAIDAAREDICICAQDLNQSNGRSLREVALMAMACAGDTGVDGLTENQRSVDVKWLSPAMPSVVTQADAATKVSAAAPWFAESDEFLRMLGFDEPTIRQLAGARASNNTQRLIATFAQGGQRQGA